MTPPPNSIPWRNSPPYVPPSPQSISDMSSTDFPSSKRPSDPSLQPTFTDLIDVLDAMMQPPPHRLTTSRTKWDGYKAFAATGTQIIDWLVEHSFAYTTESAAVLATKLVRISGLIPLYKVQTADQSFQPDARHKYAHRGLTMMSEHGLNVSVAFVGKPRDICAVLSDLNAAFAQLCHTAVSVDGHHVEYSAIRASAPWRRTLLLLAELVVCDDSTIQSASPSFKQASFYNLYNILIFHAKLVYGHPTDLLKRSKFFNEAAYIIAGKKITSVELEHSVCRRTMAASDNRFEWVLAEKDPRMHFILNCGAQSCPPLVPLEADNIDAQLKEATSAFIENNCDVNLTAKTVTLSRLWKWFRPDFTPSSTSDDDLISWISQHASESKKKELAKLTASDYKIKFRVYNWADNGDVSAKPDVRFMAIYDLSFANTV